ncbi:MAG: AbrB/MazE/SpoVT family DNA-binding domain-containing protein, partial [Acidiferrobacter sp.]
LIVGKECFMWATMTDKGQITIPKEIREKLRIGPGSKLDFELLKDRSLRVCVLARGGDSLLGLVYHQGQVPLGCEAMDNGIAEAVEARNRPPVE